MLQVVKVTSGAGFSSLVEWLGYIKLEELAILLSSSKPNYRLYCYGLQEKSPFSRALQDHASYRRKRALYEPRG